MSPASNPSPAPTRQDLDIIFGPGGGIQLHPSICPRCFDPSKGEVFHYSIVLRCTWNVNRARALAADGRKPLEVMTPALEYFVSLTTITEEHLPHVDVSQPGLLGTIPVPDLKGGCTDQVILLDGHHRAARCLRDGLPFHAYLLNQQETTACMHD